MYCTGESVTAKLNLGHEALIPSVPHRRPLFSRPISSLSFRAPPPSQTPSFKFTPITASSSSSSEFPSSNSSDNENPKPRLFNKPLNPLRNLNPYFSQTLATFPSTFIKTTLIAATAAAAIFFSRFHFFNVKPAFASSAGAAAAEAASKDTLDEAEREKAIEEHLLSHPNDVEALRNLMEIRIKNRKMLEAIMIVEKLIELEPNEVEWPLMKSHLHVYSGELEFAKNGFSGIISKDPFRVEAYHGLVMAASQDDSTEELKDIERKIEDAMKLCKKENKKSDLRDFKLLLAQIRVIEGKYDDALKFYQDLVREEPRDFRPYLCQGIIYTLLRKKDEAEKSFEKYRRLVPKGHPYARYFEDNMIATKVFAQKVENDRVRSRS
ncbi:protein SLOW GREEN 1, chloroplastic-like [Coffea arabica]|uniref:Protein SLOW GREEN 1, chloroplastic-like n=1 Tax=Coffea arabica TaxID=13443 RepID=A0ABM4ULI9_COFAR|nr:protein SLOW GREEN 1, chloroplastic-like [Coffea arabica]